MVAMRAVALALAAGVASVRAADQPAPTQFQGSWVGTLRTKFALANVLDDQSWNCLPNGAQVTIPNISLNITASTFTRGEYPQQTVNAGLAQFTWPAGNEFVRGWAGITNAGLLTLRASTTILECYYAVVQGTGLNRKLTIVTLGGTAYEWEDQCTAASYTGIINLLTNPVCIPVSNEDESAFNTTTIQTFTLVGANNGTNNNSNNNNSNNNNNNNNNNNQQDDDPNANVSGAGTAMVAGMASLLAAGAAVNLW
jgi:hypothetical protein